MVKNKKVKQTYKPVYEITGSLMQRYSDICYEVRQIILEYTKKDKDCSLEVCPYINELKKPEYKRAYVYQIVKDLYRDYIKFPIFDRIRSCYYKSKSFIKYNLLKGYPYMAVYEFGNYGFAKTQIKAVKGLVKEWAIVDSTWSEDCKKQLQVLLDYKESLEDIILKSENEEKWNKKHGLEEYWKVVSAPIPKKKDVLSKQDKWIKEQDFPRFIKNSLYNHYGDLFEQLDNNDDIITKWENKCAEIDKKNTKAIIEFINRREEYWV